MNFVHQALLYSSDREFLDVTGPFVVDGILAGETVVAVTTRHNVALLREAVGGSERLEYIDADTWYLTPGGTHAAYYRRAVDYRGPGRLRVIGEPVWAGLRTHEIVEWKRYESILNATFANTSSWVLCPYDARVLPSDVTADAARTHPEILGRVGPVASEIYTEPEEFGRDCDLMRLPEPAGEIQRASLRDGDIRSARGLIRRIAQTHGLAEPERDRLVTAAYELLSILQNSGDSGEVVLWTDGRDLICDLSSQDVRVGSPHSGYAQPDFDNTEPTPDIPLWLARCLCDYVEQRMEDGRTIVRLRMHLT